MITLFKTIRLWQLKTKWKLALMQLFDKHAGEIIKNPDEIGTRLISALTGLIHSEPQETKQE